MTEVTSDQSGRVISRFDKLKALSLPKGEEVCTRPLHEVFETEDEATNWAITWLRKHGFSIARKPTLDCYLRPNDLRRQCGLKSSAFTLRLYHAQCPPFDAVRGKSGRIIYILFPNEPLLEWLKRPTNPGRAATAARDNQTMRKGDNQKEASDLPV